MAAERRCRSTRIHKPHLWSRTTKRTVTEETTGDTLQCPGSLRPDLQTKEDPRGPQITADARSGRNWAAERGYGPACTCGMRPEAGHSNVRGVPVERKCYRHGR